MFGRIVVGLVIVLLVLVGVAFLLPQKVHVERSVEIAAPQDQVFALVNSFERFNEWSPWFERDPNARYTFEGPASGVGAIMRWQSENREVGQGVQEIVVSEPPSVVRVRLDFGSQGPAEAYYQLVATANGTAITWGLDTDLGMNPVNRYFGLFFDNLIGGDYEKGLAKLKAVAEAAPPAAPSDPALLEAPTSDAPSGEAAPQ